jgi:hypothetical protein
MNNHLSPSIIEHTNKQKTIYDIGNTIQGLRQAQKCGRVKPVNERYFKYFTIIA